MVNLPRLASVGILIIRVEYRQKHRRGIHGTTRAHGRGQRNGLRHAHINRLSRSREQQLAIRGYDGPIGAAGQIQLVCGHLRRVRRAYRTVA